MTSPATTAAVLTTVNPATEQVLSDYIAADWADADRALDAARTARADWASLSPADRAAVLRRVGQVLRERAPRLAALITAEMGKPIGEAAAEVAKCAGTCDYYADHADAFLADEPVATEASASWVSYEPLGTVLAVMPWNFPFWQAIRFAAPALLAGNAVILKHAPNTSGCALALADVLAAAGLPPGVFGVLLVAESDVPGIVARLIADDRIDAVTATGSERAGAAIGAAAGRALKKSVLELGGSDPFVVLDDADLPAAVDMAVRSRFTNAGQSCIAAKRFIVCATAAEEFTARLTAAVQALTVGDPTDPATRIGPLARRDLVDALARQVAASVERGATVTTGAHRPDRTGYFYTPTVIADVTPDMPVCQEETFGPVAAVLVAADDEEAVRIANSTPWGLAASVWTGDTLRGRSVARRLRSGTAFVNAVPASDPRLPFGGVGRSGYGRELSVAGLREFVNTRTWWVQEQS